MQDYEYIPTKQTILAISLLLLAFAFGVLKAQGENTGNPADVEQIQQLQKLYVASIDGANIGLVDQVWSHSRDVIFVEPLGTERGLLQVEGFVRNTFGKMFSKRDLQLENPSIHVYGETAWSEMTWTFHATIRDGGKPLTTKGRETQILRKENGAWHIMAIHYSGLPVNGKLQGF